MSKRPRSPQYRLAASITKAELNAVSALCGAANAIPLGGYPPETLRLATFAGKWDAGAGKFVGEYRFETLPVPVAMKFELLPGVGLEAEKPVPGRKSENRPAASDDPAGSEVNHG